MNSTNVFRSVLSRNVMMKYYSLAILVSAILTCSNTYADLVSVDIVAGPFQHPDDMFFTWRIIARFDDPMDRIAAVNGLTGQNAITLSLQRGVLYNQPEFEGLPLNDFPSTSIGGEPWDSYVTIGATDFPHNVIFSRDFAGDFGGIPPNVSVIEGCNFQEDNGAWFFFGSPPTVGQFDSIPGNGTYDVVIAQFTVVPISDLRLSGNVQWFSADGGGSHNTPFTAGNISSPNFADLTGDCNVNTEDLLLLFVKWGPTNYDTGPEFCPTPPDYNDDGVVDVFDLEFLLDNWYTDCF